MIRLRSIDLPPHIQQQLHAYQAVIDALPTYPERVTQAKIHFKRYNVTKNTTFQAVRQSLRFISSGIGRCAYCEDSSADEVDHYKPKDLYPEMVFLWENFVYICGRCNKCKGDRFSVFSFANGHEVNVQRKRNAPIVPPENGSPLLLNPRVEDPMNFLGLDFRAKFAFFPKSELNAQDTRRAAYTIDILQLNRDLLLASREHASQLYVDRLTHYIAATKSGDTVNAERLHASFQRMPHPAVWHEMKRQRTVYPELERLFQQAPEALSW